MAENKFSPMGDGCVDLNILINQYYIAVELYEHEDLLNWSKLNHLLYVTGGLGAIYAFFLKNRASIETNYVDPLIFVSVLGCFVSVGFFFALLFGVKYLQNRKKKVCEIEGVLLRSGGVGIVTGPSKVAACKRGYYQFSPTNLVLLLFPVAILLGWLLVGALSVFGRYNCVL